MPLNKPLDEFTLNDWLEAQHALPAWRFRSMKALATKADIFVPYEVRGRSQQPHVVFESPADAMQIVRLEDRESLKAFDTALKKWGDEVVQALRISSAQHTGLSKETDPSRRLTYSISYKVRYDKRFGKEPVSIGFSFARHGIYLHHGAGRGEGGKQGSHWLNRLGQRMETNPASLGKAGHGRRSPKDWFNPVMDRYAPQLLDIAARYCADMVVHSEFLYL
ncbi:MAG: hypothetical protein K6B45_04685 [Bacteroidaceae bacterium]|nr:hypothetical protein [Bacteroidaceae bacterium]